MAYTDKKVPYTQTTAEFVANTKGYFDTLSAEVSERNTRITDRDNYVYGDLLEKALDIPVGHDFTPVNWLRRTVEIHKNMFMSRGFQMVSTYDSTDPSTAGDDQDRSRIDIENDKKKEYAELRMQTIDAIIKDNGGFSLWGSLAENASATGDVCLKCYYDEDQKKYVISPVEAVENVYVLWSKDDFRKFDAIAYVYQVSKPIAIRDYGASEDVQTSALGMPLQLASSGNSNLSSQPMVTVMEVTGRIPGWATADGKLKKVPEGKETELNALIIGSEVARLITDKKKIPKYYILPNKRQRRRAWGQSDISDAAIQINLTYIETLSDWRTVASKVNFQKYKAYGFGMDTELPKSEPRKIQMLPLADGQDIQKLDQGDSNQFDFRAQLDELKEQYVRETGISRVLFDDPSVTFNSNQALLTSMKPTSDIAEAKKQLWAPVLQELFEDALETLADHNPDTYKELVDKEDDWSLKVMWPSVMQKEDPIYQNMLLNRFNAGLISVQSYMEAQGDSKEELDRMRDEMTDPVTSAILGKQLPAIAQAVVNAATAEIQAWYQSTLPQPEQNANTPGVDSNGGTSAPQLNAGPSAVEGGGMVSQPGSGATAVSGQGALAQVTQNAGG